jgi:hypothetical protein
VGLLALPELKQKSNEPCPPKTRWASLIALRKVVRKRERGKKKMSKRMNKIERMKMVKAMEFIAHQINDEEIFLDWWLPGGVADGDIEYGDLSVNDTEYDEAE